MKRVLSLLMILALLMTSFVMLSSCGETENDPVESNNEENTGDAVESGDTTDEATEDAQIKIGAIYINSQP